MSYAHDDSRRTGLLRLKHLRETNEATAEEMAAARDRFDRLKDPASAPKVITAHQLFQTPAALAARLVSLALHGGRELGRTLEPSAGLGRIYRAVREVSPVAPITMVDVSPDCLGELYRITEGDSLTRLFHGDFLVMGSDKLGRFDSIIMNPPFTMGSDVRHILHARELLNPGGRLVAVCANGPRQAAKLKPLAGEWIDLPAGSFRSEGTGVETAIAIFDN